MVDIISKLIDKLQITRKVLLIIVFQITKIEELNTSRLLYFSIYLFTFTPFIYSHLLYFLKTKFDTLEHIILYLKEAYVF